MKEVLLIDHWDSFTYNIVQLLEQAGARVHVMEYGKTAFNEARKFNYVILSPGPGIVEEYPMSLEFIKQSEPEKKILGICLGMQMIAYANGASLFNQGKVRHGQRMEVYLIDDIPKSSILNIKPTLFEVGLYHSWAVNEATIQSPLKVTARSKDGIIMGLMQSNKEIEGVQFHPESFLCSVGIHIIENWLDK